MDGPSFRVVVPMYNEAAGAQAGVRAIATAIAPFAERGGLIAVDDGSHDGTRQVLQRLQAEIPGLQVVEREMNGGYGAALRTGTEAAAAARADYVIFMDSDLTNDPADLPRFIAAIDRGVDVVKATRFRAGGGMRGVPLSRARVSRLGNIVAALLFRNGLSDCTNGYRAVRTELLMRASLRERGFAVIVEELWWLTVQGAAFAEIPVVLTSRTEDLRPTSFQYSPATFSRYFRYAWWSFWRRRPR